MVSLSLCLFLFIFLSYLRETNTLNTQILCPGGQFCRFHSGVYSILQNSLFTMSHDSFRSESTKVSTFSFAEESERYVSKVYKSSKNCLGEYVIY